MLGQHCIGILSTECCPITSERTLHKKITCAILAQSAQRRFRRKITYIMLAWSACANIAHKNYLCIVDPKPKNNFATLSWPKLHKEITYACPWLIDNFYEENNLYNVLSTMLGQYCIGILSSQCYPNTYERTLHKKITCAILAQSAQQWFWRKVTYTILSWSAWAKIAQNNNLYNAETATRCVLQKKGVLKNFALFTRKHLCWSFFLIKLRTFRTATLLKRNSSTDALRWNLGHFQNTYF